MLDKSIFNELSKVNGYRGAVLSEHTGEVLVVDIEKSDNIEEISLKFNEDFRKLHDIARTLGLGETTVMEIDADDATVVAKCSGTNAPYHLHAFAVLDKDGSMPLAKVILDDVLKEAMKELG